MQLIIATEPVIGPADIAVQLRAGETTTRAHIWKYFRATSPKVVQAEAEVLFSTVSKEPEFVGLNLEREWWGTGRHKRDELLHRLLQTIHAKWPRCKLGLITFGKYMPGRADIKVSVDYWMPMVYGTRDKTISRKLRKVHTASLAWPYAQFMPVMPSGRLAVRNNAILNSADTPYSYRPYIKTWGGLRYGEQLPTLVSELKIEHVAYYYGYGHYGVWNYPNFVLYKGEVVHRPSLKNIVRSVRCVIVV